MARRAGYRAADGETCPDLTRGGEAMREERALATARPMGGERRGSIDEGGITHHPEDAEGRRDTAMFGDEAAGEPGIRETTEYRRPRRVLCGWYLERRYRQIGKRLRLRSSCRANGNGIAGGRRLGRIDDESDDVPQLAEPAGFEGAARTGAYRVRRDLQPRRNTASPCQGNEPIYDVHLARVDVVRAIANVTRHVGEEDGGRAADMISFEWHAGTDRAFDERVTECQGGTRSGGHMVTMHGVMVGRYRFRSRAANREIDVSMRCRARVARVGGGRWASPPVPRRSSRRWARRR